MASQAIWLLFFLSGACGLVYEVLWTRYLGLIFGNTVQSLAAVLSAFMAGLALGSYLAGRFLCGRRKLLFIYGVLELFVGAYCAALPWLLEAVTPLYGTLYGETGGTGLGAARFAISFLLLLIPTTCMGATLPVLSQFMVRSPEGISRTAGALYAVNTLGAVLGSAGAGFFLLPFFGLAACNGTAVLGNLGIGAVALVLGRRSAPGAGPSGAETPAGSKPRAESEAAAAPTADGVSPQAMRAATCAFAVTGFAALATQIGWTRALSLSLGSSTYAFSLIVSIFILGLALGGAWGARIAPKLGDPVGALAQILLLIGVLALALAALLGWGPVLFFWLIALSTQWGFGALLLAEAWGVAALLLMPTFLMGATMPLTLQVVRRRDPRRDGVGRTVGFLYALNTLGAIAGSLLGGLVLLPLLQIQNTLAFNAVLYSLMGGILFMYSPLRRTRRGQVLALVFLLGTVALNALLPAWEPQRMTLGAYLLREPQAMLAVREGRFVTPAPLAQEILYYREGQTATVAILKTGLGLTLSIGGKPDASSHGDMSTQVGLALVPALLHAEGPREVLVIGMGSGVSVGAALTPSTVERVDVVEISPEVMEASSFFAEFSGLKYEEREGHWLLAEQSKKVEVLINDGRNHLLLTSRRYDVIASEPSNPWIAGIGNLFTVESFELCRRRLKPGGLLCQWLHRYGLGEREFKCVLASFAKVFPHAQLWCVLPGSDFLLIGSERPLRPRYRELLQRMSEPALGAFLQRVNFHYPEELLACFVADGARLSELAADAPLHTDDNMLLEFAAPRTLHSGGEQFSVLDWRVSPERVVDFSALNAAASQKALGHLDRSIVGRSCFDSWRDGLGLRQRLIPAALALAPRQIWALLEFERLKMDPQAWAEVQRYQVSTLDKYDPERVIREAEAWKDGLTEERRRQLAAAYETRAGRHLEHGRLAEAQADVERAARLGPQPLAALWRVRLARARGDLDACLAEARKAKDSGVSAPLFTAEIAGTYLDLGKTESALALMDKILADPPARQDPDTLGLWALRAEAFFRQDDLPHLLAAVEAWRIRTALDPLDAPGYLQWAELELRLGRAFEAKKQEAQALEHLRRARAAAHAACVLAPRDPAPRLVLARTWLRLGAREAVRQACGEAQSLGGNDFKLPDDLEAALKP